MADIAKAKRNVARMVSGGASEQEIDSYLATEGLNAAALGQAPKTSLTENIGGAVGQAAKMIPFGDELMAAGGVVNDLVSGKLRPSAGPGLNVIDPDSIKESWDRQRQFQREGGSQFEQVHPNAAALSRGVGIAANAAIPIGQAAGAGSVLGNMARGAVTAGTQAGLSGFADDGTLQERLGNASKAAWDPLTLSLGAGFGRMAARSGRSGKALTSDELRRMKTAAYEDVDNAGVHYDQGDYDNLISDIEQAAKKQRLVPGVAPKGARTLRNFKNDPYVNPSLSDIEQMRQITNRNIPIKEEGADKVYGELIRDKIDDFVDNTLPGTTGFNWVDNKDVSGAVQKARGLNSRYRKTKSVEDAVEYANQNVGASGGNADNAIRQQIKGVYRKQKGLTPEEQKAFDKVIQGSKLQNTLRTVGRLAPQNGLTMAMSIGGTAVNPAFAAFPVVGSLARSASENMTKRHVKELLKVVSQAPKNSNAAVDALRRLMAFKTAQMAGASRGNNEDK